MKVSDDNKTIKLNHNNIKKITRYSVGFWKWKRFKIKIFEWEYVYLRYGTITTVLTFEDEENRDRCYFTILQYLFNEFL